MAMISKFPTIIGTNKISCHKGTKGEKTQIELLSTLMQLAWDDIEAFLSLEANCLSPKPVKINQRAKKKLEKLELIDKNGYTPLNINTLVRSIMFDHQCQNRCVL